MIFSVIAFSTQAEIGQGAVRQSVLRYLTERYRVAIDDGRSMSEADKKQCDGADDAYHALFGKAQALDHDVPSVLSDTEQP